MTYFGSTPDYDRYLDAEMERRFAEGDAFALWCEENDMDPEDDSTLEVWEDFKRADMESQLRDEDMLAERMEMELRDGE